MMNCNVAVGNVNRLIFRLESRLTDFAIQKYTIHLLIDTVSYNLSSWNRWTHNNIWRQTGTIILFSRLITIFFLQNSYPQTLREIIKISEKLNSFSSGGFAEYVQFIQYMTRTGKFSFKNISLLNVIEVLHSKL